MIDQDTNKNPDIAPIQNSNQSESPKDKKMRMYPELIVPYNEHPKRWLAFPLIGYVIKLILLIPVYIIFIFLEIWYGILMFITPFVILFTGKYWNFAYKYSLVYMRIYTKIILYLFGLTDKYPGFGLDENSIYTLRIDKPVKSSRLLGFPLIGYLIRIILLIPFSLYTGVLGMGAFVALVISWFAVLFTGRYPESLYEFIKDYLRIWNANIIYTSYLSDTYPSFHISFNHKKIKIFLLIAGAVLAFCYYSITISNDIQNMQHQSTNINPAPNSAPSNY